MKTSIRLALCAIAIALLCSACTPQGTQSPLADCTAAHSLDDALARCTEVINAKDSSPHDRAIAYSYRASANQASGKPDAALEDADASVRLAPGDAVVLGGRGSIYAAQNRLDEAATDLDAAIRIDPNNLMAVGNRGLVYEKLGQWEQARSSVERVLQLDPKSPNGWGEKCWIGAVHTPADANTLPDCNKAIELADIPNNYNSRGMAFYRTGKFNEAIADYSHAIEGDPNVGSSYYMRGMAKQATGAEDAQADLDKGLQLEPGVRERYARLGIFAP